MTTAHYEDKRFPHDCDRECPHYRAYDMSVDDWTNICTLIPAQVDDCDMDFVWYYCPLGGSAGKGGSGDV